MSKTIKESINKQHIAKINKMFKIDLFEILDEMHDEGFKLNPNMVLEEEEIDTHKSRDLLPSISRADDIK